MKETYENMKVILKKKISMKITHIIETFAGIYKGHFSLSYLAVWLHKVLLFSL
jgi:hypothetical protein